jgi:hypothetical protein
VAPVLYETPDTKLVRIEVGPGGPDGRDEYRTERPE